MAYTVIRPADHDGWLAERAKGIGSSDAGTIMGVSPFSTPLRLWRQRMGIDPPIPETASMRNGHYLEGAVAAFFAGETGAVIDQTSEGDWIAADTKRPYLRVSPDRLFWPYGVEQTPGNRLVLEIKSTSKFVDPDNLPLYWLCQVQYQMGILGCPMAVIAWITSQPKLQMDYKWIPFNKAFFDTQVAAIDRFWNENILKGIQPEGMDEEDYRLMYPTSEAGKIAYATEDDLTNCQEYVRLQAEKEDIEKRISEVTAAIKASIADAETLNLVDPETNQHTVIARFKSINETVLDEEKFFNENPEEYNKYLKKVFDKALFKDEDKVLFNKYSEKKKGARRFAVLVKNSENAIQN